MRAMVVFLDFCGVNRGWTTVKGEAWRVKRGCEKGGKSRF